MINQYMVEGKIVPGEVTVSLMKKAIEKHAQGNKRKVLIDGFPRSQQNLDVWQKVMAETATVPFVLFLDANEDAMIERIMERAKTSGRTDDNPESLKKRFAVFKGESLPIVEHFEAKGKVRRVDPSAAKKRSTQMSAHTSKAIFDITFNLRLFIIFQNKCPPPAALISKPSGSSIVNTCQRLPPRQKTRA
jgi:adenylate kinase family enzyme